MHAPGWDEGWFTLGTLLSGPDAYADRLGFQAGDELNPKVWTGWFMLGCGVPARTLREALHAIHRGGNWHER